MRPPDRPARLLVVVGTGTEVGKTWVAARFLTQARTRGLRVAARKPVQSFDPASKTPTDAEQLAFATGESVERVCPRHRWYEVAMAPPMAADVLNRPPLLVDQLIGELNWGAGIDLGLIETAGGIRSPLTHDADNCDFVRRVAPEQVVLVADAGLGTINAVRLATQALSFCQERTSVLLNRFEPDNDLHQRNREWLVTRDGLRIIIDPALI